MNEKTSIDAAVKALSEAVVRVAQEHFPECLPDTLKVVIRNADDGTTVLELLIPKGRTRKRPPPEKPR
jgi:hypothetical protein